MVVAQRLRVLGVEHGLAGVEERLERIALVVFEALLVDGEVERPDESRNLIECVLQSDEQPACVSCFGEKPIEVELVGGGVVEPWIVRVSVDVVGLDAVAALLCCEVESSFDHGAH